MTIVFLLSPNIGQLFTADSTKSFNYGAMAGAFIEAIKELASQVSELKKIIKGNQ